MQTYDDKKALELDELILQVNNLEQLYILNREYGDEEHPHIGYLLGTRFYNYGNNIQAFYSFLNSASYGVSLNTPWAKTIYADSIAQSIFNLIDKFNFKIEFEDTKYKLVGHAYYLFSVMINKFGANAYNSLYTRGLLIEKAKSDNIVLRFIQDYYFSGKDLVTDILSASDFAYAAMGFKKNDEPNNYDYSFAKFENSFKLIKSKPQYELIDDSRLLLEISRKNQELLYKNVSGAYLDGRFSISKEAFIEKTENAFKIK